MLAKRSTLLAIITVFVFSSCFMLGVAANNSKVMALSGSSFKAGRIIDDGKFYDGNTMNGDQIQRFLDSKVPNCDENGSKPHGGTTRKQYAASRGVSTPFICLKSFRQDTPARASESGLCGNLSAMDNRRASQIINDVAEACNISEKVLLVLLEKEQSLVTDEWPWPIQYRSATGYGCPDTAACDSEYYGFFNQVYSAAKQYKRYKLDANFYNHIAGRNNNVRFHPNASCGSSVVFIQNYATAGLYNYTPYQPNQAALNNLYGTGNNCSAYGNRNFWRIYSNWFGSTTGPVPQSKVLTGDWDGDGRDNVGLKRNDGYYLDFNYTGGPEKTIRYGRASDKVIIGDWDGDGKDETGLKRGTKHFMDFNSDGQPDMQVTYGRATDQGMVGDWDGDGTTETGLKRGSTYFFDFNNDGKPDRTVRYGRASDKVIIGDWDGDGKDETGLRRGSTYYLDFNNNGTPEKTIRYGRSTDSVIIGDWNDDGKDTTGLRRGTYFLPPDFYIDNNNDGSPETSFTLINVVD